MSATPCDPPLEATVEAFSTLDMVGKLALADGRTMKFGASALHGFDGPPDVGEEVCVHAFEEHPRLGLRAKVVKKSAAIEAARRAGAVRALDDASARQEAHDAAWKAFRNELPAAPIAVDWAPRIDYECPPLAVIPRYLDELDIEQINDGLERLLDVLDQTLPIELLPTLEGTSVPWNRFWDPMLWPVADDGGGNLVGVHLAAYFHQGAPAPAVFWFHETGRHWLLADDLETFLRETQAFAREQNPSADSPFLRKLSSAEKAAWADEGDWSWLWPQGLGERPANMSETFYRERTLIAELFACLNDEPCVGEERTQIPACRSAFAKLLEVESLYEAAGWTAPLAHVRFQRRRLFR